VNKYSSANSAESDGCLFVNRPGIGGGEFIILQFIADRITVRVPFSCARFTTVLMIDASRTTLPASGNSIVVKGGGSLNDKYKTFFTIANNHVPFAMYRTISKHVFRSFLTYARRGPIKTIFVDTTFKRTRDDGRMDGGVERHASRSPRGFRVIDTNKTYENDDH